ncbi:hypothetical protein [Halorhabdus sp. BNX81]|uniref:DUF7557 family protein n=1 Tax=Halorhabdus sp. BNX81 TaxID=2980181 RepID=UPI0023DD6500|nr:hypothetical protein [Halorhabdus sp. BNX81]WEL21321.1 Uncharacterized protein HBNXHr_1256 [Halorhabdus sp. BNX81]
MYADSRTRSRNDQRLDSLRVDDESDDEIVTELINIHETQVLTLFHGGDEL